jgi:hypothetical protein
MFVNGFHHPFLHDASWVRAVNINNYDTIGCKGTNFGTNNQIIRQQYL